MAKRFSSFLLVASLGATIACSTSGEPVTSEDGVSSPFDAPIPLAKGESVLTIAATNDIHGHFEHIPFFSGYVAALRKHVDHSYGANGKMLLLDGGDATQGTLLSNYSEGLLANRLMGRLGYTAAVAGNHGFDFGPSDWTRDQCDPKIASCDPLGALRALVGQSAFPLLGANVRSVATGKPIDILPAATTVDFLGRRIAIIGLENQYTPSTTVSENVTGLRFDQPRELLAAEVERAFVAGEADVFVLTMHEGDSNTYGMRDFLASLPKRSDGEPLVAAAVAAHSHAINDATSGDIPYVQSGANGEMFGVIELVLTKRADGRLVVDRSRTRKKAALPISHYVRRAFGEDVVRDPEVERMVSEGEKIVAPIAHEALATAADALTRDGARASDSVLGRILADAMRASTQGAAISMINSGDMRAELEAGPIDYETLYDVLPKNLLLAHVPSMPTTRLVANVLLSIRSCGRRGALQISGLRVVFERDCTRAEGGEDPSAKLRKLVLDDGRTLYEQTAAGETFLVDHVDLVTTDFVLTGGAGYGAFEGMKPLSPMPPLRRAIADRMKALKVLSASGAGTTRYLNCLESKAEPLCL